MRDLQHASDSAAIDREGVAAKRARRRAAPSVPLPMAPSTPPVATAQVDPMQLLRQHGLQVTAQRLAMLRAVSSRPHATAEMLAEDVRTAIGAISRQAAYDTLAVLVDKRLVRRIQTSGSPARFEDRVGDNHHHLICRGCGAVSDVDCAVGAAPCLTASAAHGFEIDEAEVIYWGRCAACRAAVGAVSAEVAQAHETGPPAGRRKSARTRLT